MEALDTLRTKIVPLVGINDGRVRELSFFIVSPSQEESRVKSCEKLLEELKDLLPPRVMIPENGLVKLIEQVIDMRKNAACVLRNRLLEEVLLITDHRYGREHEIIPSKTLQILEEHKDEVLFLRFSHNGRYLASSSRDGLVIIWEVQETGLLSAKHRLSGHEGPVSHASWTADDLRLYTRGSQEEANRLWDTSSCQCLGQSKQIGLGAISCGRALNGRNRGAYVFNKVIHFSDAGRVQNWPQGPTARTNAEMEITSNGKELITIGDDENTIVLLGWESSSVRYIREDEVIVSFSSSKDSRFLLVSLLNGKIHLWDIDGRDPKLVATYQGYRRSRFVVRSCFGGLEEAFIASGSEDSQVYIWRRDSGELILTLAGHSGVVNCVSWNPTNPHMLASASDDRTIRIWGT